MPGAMHPAVSVVLPTYNRAHLLEGAIGRLMEQAPGSPAYEVVLVDNNSTDDTRAVVERLAVQYGYRIRYVFERRQGVSHARNAGVAAASAPIVAFTDDDVRVAPDWIASIVLAFRAIAAPAYVGGRVLPDWPSEPPAWLTRDHWAPLALTDHGNRSFTVNRENPLCLVGASLAVRREVFDRVGRFDPTFYHVEGAVSSLEDHEFQLRCWRAGLEGRYEPAILVHAVVQPERMTMRYHRRWMRDHARVVPRLLKPGECYDASGALVHRTGDRTVLGVPPWRVKALAKALARLALSLVTFRLASAIRWEGQVWEHVAELRVALGTHTPGHTNGLA